MTIYTFLSYGGGDTVGCFRYTAGEFRAAFGFSFNRYREKCGAFDTVAGVVDHIFGGDMSPEYQASYKAAFFREGSRREINEFMREYAENFGDYHSAGLIEKAIRRAAVKRDGDGFPLICADYAAEIEKQYFILDTGVNPISGL